MNKMDALLTSNIFLPAIAIFAPWKFYIQAQLPERSPYLSIAQFEDTLLKTLKQHKATMASRALRKVS